MTAMAAASAERKPRPTSVPVVATNRDNRDLRTYAAAMAGEEPHIILTLDTKEPIELGAFVGAFVSLGQEYERFIKTRNPEFSAETQLYVREVRAGSIEADIIPWILPLLDTADKVLIIEQFIRLWGSRFQALLGHGQGVIGAPETKSELDSWARAVKAIATDPDASAKLEAAVFEDGKKKIKAAFTFDTQEAQEVLRTVEKKKNALESRWNSDFQRVLMVFTRSDVGTVAVGKSSGERVIIEEIQPRPLPLIYGSELAEERIKHEIREADENVYKKGFIVDVNVRTSGGRPVGYAVTNVHQVIDLPEE